MRGWAKRIAEFYLFHLLFIGIVGPLVGAAILIISPLSARDMGLVLPLTVALVLFLGLSAYFMWASIGERRRPKSP